MLSTTYVEEDISGQGSSPVHFVQLGLTLAGLLQSSARGVHTVWQVRPGAMETLLPQLLAPRQQVFRSFPYRKMCAPDT